MTEPKDVKILDNTGKWQSLKGPPGPPGPGIHMLGSLKTEAELAQHKTGRQPGDAFMTEDDGFIHVWDGTKFINTKIQGKEGKEGKQGPAGRSVQTFPITEGDTEPPAAAHPDDPLKDPKEPHYGDIMIVAAKTP